MDEDDIFRVMALFCITFLNVFTIEHVTECHPEAI